MARALMGHVGSATEHALAFEVARLRRRVAELEAELAALREHARETLDIELHRLPRPPNPRSPDGGRGAPTPAGTG